MMNSERLRVRDHADERPCDLVIRTVGGLDLPVVVRQRPGAFAAEGVAQRGRGQAPGFVAVGDALAVEGVDGAGGVPGQQHVGSGSRPHRQTHGQLASGGRAEAGLRREAPRLRGPVHEGIHEVGGVDALPTPVGREEADTDVDPSVPHREDPAVAGDDIALGVANVQVRLYERIVMAVRGVVAAQGHAEGQVPAAIGAQHPTDP
jgi:hypothetical protein